MKGSMVEPQKVLGYVKKKKVKWEMEEGKPETNKKPQEDNEYEHKEE